MIVNSYAKINIGLHILNKREDNFHNIITIFQEIDFCDQISIEKSDNFIFYSIIHNFCNSFSQQSFPVLIRFNYRFNNR